jgi:hypothetical protein
MITYTRTQIIGMIETLLTRKQLRKVDVYEVISCANRTMENAQIGLLEYIHTQHSESDKKLYYSLPNTMIGLNSRKFTAALKRAEESEFKTAVLGHKEEWEKVKELTDHLTEVYKEHHENNKKPYQYKYNLEQWGLKKGICPGCFTEKVLKLGSIEDHPALIKGGDRDGICYGSAHPHFGSETGYQFSISLSIAHWKLAKSLRKRANIVAKGRVRLTDIETLQPLDNQTKQDIDREVERLRKSSEYHENMSYMLDDHIAQWIPEDVVKVRPNTSTLRKRKKKLPKS